MSHVKTAVLGTVAAFILAGCQTTADANRAVLGAAVGCAVGEIIEDGECVTGGALGALGGVLADDIGLVR